MVQYVDATHLAVPCDLKACLVAVTREIQKNVKRKRSTNLTETNIKKKKSDSNKCYSFELFIDKKKILKKGGSLHKIFELHSCF